MYCHECGKQDLDRFKLHIQGDDTMKTAKNRLLIALFSLLVIMNFILGCGGGKSYPDSQYIDLAEERSFYFVKDFIYKPKDKAIEIIDTDKYKRKLVAVTVYGIDKSGRLARGNANGAMLFVIAPFKRGLTVTDYEQLTDDIPGFKRRVKEAVKNLKDNSGWNTDIDEQEKQMIEAEKRLKKIS